uniref:transcription factor 7-like 1-C isoform X1 n=1 Tax=Doryrhamphus excisus TaxID=161450 RepID=UPI0025AE476B|nr:transcription factor 7-like 1-C isoform X1 [Doryrhamphus excisus]
MDHDLSDQLFIHCDHDILGDTPNPSLSPNLPSPCDPESIYTELRTVEGEVDGSGVWFPLGKTLDVPAAMMASPSLEPSCCAGFMPPLPPYSHGLVSGGGQQQQLLETMFCQASSALPPQCLPYGWPATPFAPHSHLDDDAAMMMQPPGINLTSVGLMKRNAAQRNPTLSCVPLPTPNTTRSMKRDRDSHQDEKTYVKKPLNAFMLYRQEQRPNVVAQLNIRNSAIVNKVVGQMWKSLTKRQQRKYYELADAEKLLHAQQHPEWSCTENYGKKRKRQRNKVNTDGQEHTLQAQMQDATTPVHAAVDDSPHKSAMMLCAQTQLRVMLELMV